MGYFTFQKSVSLYKNFKKCVQQTLGRASSSSISDCWIHAKRFFAKAKLRNFAFDLVNTVRNKKFKKLLNLHKISNIFRLQPSKSVDE